MPTVFHQDQFLPVRYRNFTIWASAAVWWEVVRSTLFIGNDILLLLTNMGANCRHIFKIKSNLPNVMHLDDWNTWFTYSVFVCCSVITTVASGVDILQRASSQDPCSWCTEFKKKFFLVILLPDFEIQVRISIELEFFEYIWNDNSKLLLHKWVFGLGW